MGDAAEPHGKVSALITTRQRPESLERAINSLLACGYPGPLELIVVDDASDQPVSARMEAYLAGIAGKHGIRAKYHRNGERRGIISNRSFLVSLMAPDSAFALIMDDDVELESGALGALAGCLRLEPEAGIAGPRIVFMKDRGRTAHCANFVGPWTGFYTESDPPARTRCDWLLSGCLLVKREALRKTGGFYPGFFASHAEADFCLAAKRAGFSVFYCPEAVVAHDEEPGQFKRDRLYYVYRNKLLVIRRNFPFPRMLTALFFSGFVALPVHILESLRHHGGACLPELKLVLLAFVHGLSGREGPL